VERAFAGTAEEDTLFETASVFKTITAMTLAAMVENGETSLDRTLAEVFPDADFADPDAASTTLEDLATHHSGPPTAPDGDPLGQWILPAPATADPYRHAAEPPAALSPPGARHPT
jgi:CubicO group peptidase (beta-lactamase class C family)